MNHENKNDIDIEFSPAKKIDLNFSSQDSSQSINDKNINKLYIIAISACLTGLEVCYTAPSLVVVDGAEDGPYIIIRYGMLIGLILLG